MEEIRDELVERLRFRNVENPPFLVCFSGTPLSGKSTVAKILQQRYNMVRIENDMIRGIRDRKEADVDAYSFLNWFLRNYDLSNERIVLDSSIDRNYGEILEICYENDIPVFIVKMPIPEDLDARSLERNGQNWDEWAHEPVEKYLEDHRKASKELEYDFIFGENGGMKKLLEKLDRRLEK